MAQDAEKTTQIQGEPQGADERVYPGAPARATAEASERPGSPAPRQRRAAIVLAAVSALLIVAALAMVLGNGQPAPGGLMRTVAGQGSEPVASESQGSAGEPDGDAGSLGDAAAGASGQDGASATGDSKGAAAGSDTGSPSATSGTEASGGQPSEGPAPSTGESAKSEGASTEHAPAQAITVSVVVDASAAGGGTLASTTLTFQPGATAYDALRGTGLSVNARGTAYGTYVAAIGGYAEKEHGGASGWTYSVNGTSPTAACDAYELSNGDVVRWTYVASN